MSSHQCRVSGAISTRADVTEEQVHAALQPFLDVHGLDYGEQEAKDNIEWDGSTLFLGIDFWSYGRYSDDSIDPLADSLASIVLNQDYIEVFDYDTGSEDEHCCPVFIGPDDAAKARARMLYGISELEVWVQPLIGADAFESVKSAVLALPIIENGGEDQRVIGWLESDDGCTENVLFANASAAIGKSDEYVAALKARVVGAVAA